MVYNSFRKTDTKKRGAQIHAPFYNQTMIQNIDFLVLIKHVIAAALVIGIILAPAWIARQNDKGKPDMHAVRLGSWIFGWSFIAWLWSVFWASRK